MEIWCREIVVLLLFLFNVYIQKPTLYLKNRNQKICFYIKLKRWCPTVFQNLNIWWYPLFWWNNNFVFGVCVSKGLTSSTLFWVVLFGGYSWDFLLIYPPFLDTFPHRLYQIWEFCFVTEPMYLSVFPWRWVSRMHMRRKTPCVWCSRWWTEGTWSSISTTWERQVLTRREPCFMLLRSAAG